MSLAPFHQLEIHLIDIAGSQKLEKVVPDQPKNSTPVHLRKKQIYAHYPIMRPEPFVPEKAAETQAPSSSS